LTDLRADKVTGQGGIADLSAGKMTGKGVPIAASFFGGGIDVTDLRAGNVT
jgi:hypothetical protein